MIIAALPSNETQRLETLTNYAVLDTLPEQNFDDITLLASHICQTPISLISFVDGSRQWFKSRVGLEAAETPREISFCAHAILQPEKLLVVPDAQRDARFADNPLVKGEQHIRFYAGAPLIASDGHALGTLCVLDRTPRELSPEQQGALLALSRQVVSLLEMRRQAMELQDSQAKWRETDARFHALLDNGPVNAFIKHEDGRYAYINEPCARRFKVRPSDWIDKTDAQLWPEEFADQLREHDLGVLAQDDVIEMLETVPDIDGELGYWRSFKFPLQDLHGQKFLAGMSLDVTSNMHTLKELQDTTSRLQALVENLQAGIVVENENRCVLFANHRFCEMFDLAVEPETLAGQDCVPAVQQIQLLFQNPQEFARRVQEILRARRTVIDEELQLADGRVLERDYVPIFVEGDYRGHLWSHRDISERKYYENQLMEYQRRLEETITELEEVSRTDALTKLQNRGAFEQRLSEELLRAARYKLPLSLLMLDVDHFKQFNDTFGHPAGDEVLMRVADLMRECARPSDCVARYGGEEFALILPSTPVEGAYVLAERLRRAISQHAWPQRAVTVSIGAADISSETSDAAALVEAADKALYEAKAKGRNRVVKSESTAQY